jgi:DedD protein
MDQKLKQRLIGATVLVVLVVLVVPALLTGPRNARPLVADDAQVRHEVIDLSRPAGSVATAPEEAVAANVPEVEVASSNDPATNLAEIPAAPSTPLAPKIPAVKPAAANVTPTAVSSVPAPNVPLQGALPPPKSEAKADAKADAKAEAKQSPLSDAKHATVLPGPTEPKSSKLDVSRADVGKTQTKPVVAVAAPPAVVAESKAPVAQAPSRPPLTVASKAEAKALPKAAPKASAVDSTSGWVVQLGSFAAKDNAEKLAHELKDKKFKAFVSEFRGGGKTLWRVRVGPEQDRTRIDRIAERLRAEGHKGTVAPAQ